MRRKQRGNRQDNRYVAWYARPLGVMTAIALRPSSETAEYGGQNYGQVALWDQGQWLGQDHFLNRRNPSRADGRSPATSLRGSLVKRSGCTGEFASDEPGLRLVEHQTAGTDGPVTRPGCASCC